MKMMNGNIAVILDETNKESKGGIILPDCSHEQSKTGKVAYVSEPWWEDGFSLECGLEVGERVAFKTWGSTSKLEIDGQEYTIVHMDDLICVL